MRKVAMPQSPARKRTARRQLRAKAPAARVAAVESNEIVGDTQRLRGWLATCMLKVANGEQPVPVANAVCGYAQQIYNTLNIEVKRAKAVKSLGKDSIKAVSLDA